MGMHARQSRCSEKQPRNQEVARMWAVASLHDRRCVECREGAIWEPDKETLREERTEESREKGTIGRLSAEAWLQWSDRLGRAQPRLSQPIAMEISEGEADEVRGRQRT